MNNSFSYSLDRLQKTALTLMGVLVLVSFVGVNLQALWWRASDWLVSSVLPAVVIDLTNQERESNGLNTLRHSEVLDRAAKMKAEDMAKNQYFSHFSPTGVSPWYWFKKTGYVYAHAGENLAIHFTDSSEVVKAWMNSPLHRANIVNKNYTEIGVGTARGEYEGYQTIYVVQFFGTPAALPSTSPVTTEDGKGVNSTLKERNGKIKETQSKQISEIPTKEKKVSEIISVEATKTPKEKDFSFDKTALSNKKTAEPDVKPAVIKIREIKGVKGDRKENIPFLKLVNNSEPSILEADTLVFQTALVATSSGLAVASVVTENKDDNNLSVGLSALATEPGLLLKVIYLFLGSVILFLLVISVLTELRQARYLQVGYGVLLLIVMGGLWSLQSYLVSGAVVL